VEVRRLHGANDRKENAMNDKPLRFPRWLAVAALAVGVAGGSYGVASAASGASGNSGSTASGGAATAPSTTASQKPWGMQRSDETLLTGDTAAKVREVALAKVAGGTVVRVETDADGHAAYEAHMTDANGNPTTVYVDKSFNVVSVESGGPGGPGHGHGPAPSASSSTA
jgi:hypothetical protein